MSPSLQGLGIRVCGLSFKGRVWDLSKLVSGLGVWGSGFRHWDVARGFALGLLGSEFFL